MFTRRARFPQLAIVALVALHGCDNQDPADEDDGWDQLDVGKGDGPGTSTYGALALLRVPPELGKTDDAVAPFDDDIMPHEAKAMRKQIGTMRDMVDLFAFAYPRGKHRDRWVEIRDELDDGYETIGSFKDLFDVQNVEDPADAVYDDDELNERRDAALAWVVEFHDDEHQLELANYLGAPKLHELQDRPNDDMPRFYWREADLEPDEDLSGLKNMARLQRELIAKARGDLEDTKKLDDLTDEDEAVSFHDFRKRIRSIAKMAGYFPEITKTSEVDHSAELVAVVTEAVDRYGALNDRIVAWQRAHEADDDDREHEIQQEIVDGWADLRAWQKSVDLDEVLDDLRATVRK